MQAPGEIKWFRFKVLDVTWPEPEQKRGAVKLHHHTYRHSFKLGTHVIKLNCFFYKCEAYLYGGFHFLVFVLRKVSAVLF